MPRSRLANPLSRLLLAVALALSLHWATQGPNPLQRPQDRIIGAWRIVGLAPPPLSPRPPVPDPNSPGPPSSSSATVITFYRDGSVRSVVGSPERAGALRGMYALRESGEFTLELSRLGEAARSVRFTGSVRFEGSRVVLGGRLRDDQSGAEVKRTLLLEPGE